MKFEQTKRVFDERIDTMEKVVDKKGLVKDIKKRFGNFYTVPQIEKIIEEEGCIYFSKYGTTYEYLNFGKWKITRTELL